MTVSSTARFASSPADARPKFELSEDAKKTVRLLVVDDEHTLRESCRTYLTSEGYRVETTGKGKEALDLLTRREFDIVLLDQYMADVPGTKLLPVALTRHPQTVVIVMTGKPTVESGLELLEEGAWDYLTKPFSATQLRILIGRAVHAVLASRSSDSVRAEAEVRYGNTDKLTVLGTSPSFRRVIELARKVARTDASVLITGESGSGKELLAEFIHHHSRRSRERMVAINCAALPDTLLESEMFGHRKGAFTDAQRDKPGLLEVANGGTMFLDELTEMSPAIQAKLLRVIQDGVIRRVGSEDVDAVVNVRFIAATNRDPRGAVEVGMLRQDLFYRLHVVPMQLPPLRDRQEDIPILAENFLRRFWAQHRSTKEPIPVFSEAAIRTFQHHAWPGNVRELQNLVEHLVVIAEPGAEILPVDLPFIGGAIPLPGELPAPPKREPVGPYHAAREHALANFQKQYLATLVEQTMGNMSRAAAIAGVERSTLYRLLERHGMQRAVESPSEDEAPAAEAPADVVEPLAQAE
jgi:DNA-binding NtrC family response regulator